MWLAVWVLGCSSDGKGTGTATDGEVVDPPTDLDVDDDGYDQGPDCDDADPTVHPDAEEVPYDGIDQDCEDGDLVDVDVDGHAPPDDCDDLDPTVHPGASDMAGDDLDADCDGVDGVDQDGDTFASVPSGGTDCDDTDPARNPDAVEVWYDAVDQDCDGVCDYDQDGDGAVLADSPIADGTPCDSEPGPGASADQDCDDADPAASTATVVDTLPEDGSATVGPGTTVQVTLSIAEPAASLALLDAVGTPVPGTSSVVGATVSFVPDAPLAEGAAYTAELTFSCGPSSFSFTTIGPVDPATLVDRVWEADITDGTWVEPAGVGALIGILVTNTLLLTVTAEAPDLLDLRVAAGNAAVQDLCSSTVDLVGTAFDANPLFVAGPADLAMVSAGVALTIGDATLSGTFAADGSEIFELEVAGELDTRPLVPALGGGPPDTVCLLLAAFGVSCEPCSDGTGDFCLQLVVEDVPTAELVGAVIVPRTDADIAADPACP